jgi:hypothetical protein
VVIRHRQHDPQLNVPIPLPHGRRVVIQSVNAVRRLAVVGVLGVARSVVVADELGRFVRVRLQGQIGGLPRLLPDTFVWRHTDTAGGRLFVSLRRQTIGRCVLVRR